MTPAKRTDRKSSKKASSKKTTPKKTSKKTSLKKGTSRKAARKKTPAGRKATARKTAARKTAKKTSAGKGAAAGKKSAARKTAKKTSAKKTTAKKTSGKKTPAKKAAAGRKTTAKKTTAKKTTAKKTAAGKKTGAGGPAARSSAPKTTKGQGPKRVTRTRAAQKPVSPRAHAEPKRRARRPAKFDRKELATIRSQLNDELGDLQRQLRDLEQPFESTQSETTGEVGLDEDFADAGTATFERERDLSIYNNIRDLMDQIGRAIGRIDEGTYGSCERCGRPIDAARLKALPHALLCMDCKRRDERAR